MKNNIDLVGRKCESNGIFNIASEIEKTIYVYKDDEFGLVNSESQIRFKLADIPTLIKELQEIYKLCSEFKRSKRKIGQYTKADKLRDLKEAGYSVKEIAQMKEMKEKEVKRILENDL